MFLCPSQLLAWWGKCLHKGELCPGSRRGTRQHLPLWIHPHPHLVWPYRTSAWPTTSLPSSKHLSKPAHMSLGPCGSKPYLASCKLPFQGRERRGQASQWMWSWHWRLMGSNLCWKSSSSYATLSLPSHVSQTCLTPSCLNSLGNFPACHNDQDTSRMLSTKPFTSF